MELKKGSDTFKWFMDRFEWLTQLQIINSLINVAPQICWPGHPWTFVKLAVLAEYVANVYTMIIPKYYKRFVYVDLFAGCGLDVIEYKGRRVYVPGSPVIAYAFAREEFDKMILVDIKPDHLGACRQRLQSLGASPEKIVAVPGDVNDPSVVKIVLRYMPEKGHALIFVDPEGLPPNYEVMKELLQSTPSDLVILIQRRYMWMRRSNPQQQQKLTEVFGSDDWKKCSSEDELVAMYLERLSSIGSESVKRKLYDYIPVKLFSENIYYDLAFLVRETGGGSPWFKEVIPYLKEKVKEINKVIDQAFAVFTGATRTLQEFIPPKKLQLEYETGHRKLNSWFRKT